jgi:hypothetical protein
MREFIDAFKAVGAFLLVAVLVVILLSCVWQILSTIWGAIV